ncbi:hypothetical protein ACFL2U_02180 [Patescibacteria group bacterium]
MGVTMFFKDLMVECKKDKGLRNETIEIAFRLLMLISSILLILTAIVLFFISPNTPVICLLGYFIPVGKACFCTFMGGLLAFLFAIENDGNGELMWP